MTDMIFEEFNVKCVIYFFEMINHKNNIFLEWT